MFDRRILACALLVLAAASANAQLAHNGTTTAAATWTPAAPTLTVAHTTPNLANRLMLVAVHMNIGLSTGTTVASVTYAGVAATLGQSISDAGAPNTRTEVWFLIAPATGANSVIVTLQNITAGQSVQGVVGVTTYVDVDQALTGSISETGTGNSATPASTLAGSAAGDMVVDFLTIRENAAATQSVVIPGTQTAIYNNIASPGPLNANDVIAASSFVISTGANVTTQYTASSAQRWTKAGGSLRAAVADVIIVGAASPDVVDGTPTTVSFVFTITTESSGANNVNFSFPLPAGYTIVSANSTQGTCTAAATSTCAIGNLLTPGSSATVTVVATSPNSAVGTATGTATVTSGTADSVAGNNSATVSVRTQSHICSTPGKDGAAGTINGNPDTYYPATASAAAGAASITLGAVPAGYGTAAIAVGDLLLVMQMQDAAIDSSNNDRYGNGAGNTLTSSATTGTSGSGSSNLNSAGRYEYAVATNGVTVAGGTLNITGAGAGGGLLYAYTNAAATATQGQRRFQVIRVPQYSTATIAAGASAPAWNGTVGGVFVIDVAGTATMGSSAGAGTVATTIGSPTVTGTGSTFTTQVHAGDTININGQGNYTVLFVNSNTQLTLASNATATATGRTYTVPTISVSGRGFRGGAGRQLAGAAGANTDYRTLAATNTNGSKGEGIAGTPRFLFQGTGTPLDTTVDGYPNGSSARGAPGNAGGGGTDGNPAANDENSGGGGGGNAGSGGKGGNSWNNLTALTGGFGGVFESPASTRLAMGGGGGAGTTNNGTQEGSVQLGANGINSSGASGGGIVIIRANTISGTGTIASNGSWALRAANDGSGGGGAGGTIIIQSQFGTLTGLSVEAKGGNGGSSWLSQANPCSNPTCPPNATDYPGERHGPGGGGGGGAIYLSSAAASTTVTGGANGLTTQDNDPYGATAGSDGIAVTSSTTAFAGADAGFSCAIANLVVTNVDSPDPVTVNNNITYAQTLTNNGPNAADQVTFSTAVPASARFQSISVPAGWTCITPAVGGTGEITCTTPSLANGATANFSLVVQALFAPAGYTITNTANANSATPDSNYANNTATASTTVVTTATADVRATISTVTTAVANSNISYTQVVTNLGGASAANPTFSETIPPNATFQSLTPPAGWTCITPAIGGTGSITCSSGTALGSGASLSFPLTIHVNTGVASGTIITETATAGSSTQDPNSANNTASASTTIVATGSADFGTTITALTSPAPSGGFVSFSEVVTNNGVTAANATYTQNVPANTTFFSLTVPAGWTCTTPAVGGTGTITCTTTAVAATGSSFTFLPTYKVNTGTASGTVITDTVTITAAVTDSVAANNTASATSTVADPSDADVGVTKSGSPNPVGQGQLVTYLLTVVNNGPGAATSIVTSDTLPASVSFISASPSQGACAGTTTVVCSIGTLAARGTATVSIVVQANNTGTITNTATISSGGNDPAAANNSSTANVTVLAVTLVRLRELRAVQNKDRVLLTWQTSFESDNLGFNLYREVGGVRTQLNRGLIAGSALVAKKQDTNAGHAYRFRDTFDGFAQYWLEDVDIHGVHTMHGPVSPSAGDADAPANTTPLAGLGASGTVLASPAGFGVVRPLTLGDITDAQTRQQRDLAADAGLKIFVTEEGWQRVTKAAMLAAGFDPGKDSSKLALFCAGIEQPISVDDDGNVEFYGLPLDTRSTGARTYWLRAKGGNNRIKLAKDKGGDPITGSVAFTAQRRDRNIFFAALTNVEENFFGPLIMTDWETTQDLTVGALDPSYGGNATLEVSIQGGTDGITHVVAVTFDGHPLGTVSVESMTRQTFSFPLPQSWLTAGPNTLSLTALNGWDDVSLLAEARLTYQHLLRADGGALEVNLPGGRAATVGGFTSATVRAVDVTDPQRPVELEAAVATDGSGGFAATFTTPSDSAMRTVLAFDDTRRVVPQEVVANRPSSWSAPNVKGADLVVISNPAFLGAAAALEPARKAEGISTAIVDVDDVYDEFNFGIRDPQAIRAFMQNAAQWKSAPKWLLLVGDASIDPRDYLGFGSADFLPTKLVATTQLETASDDWFADVPVGRLPVRTADEAARIIGRIAARGTPSGPWASSALFIADNPDGYDFAGAAADAAALLPPSFTAHTTGPNHADIVSALNAGPILVDYLGHGSVEIWSNPDVFSSADAAALTNADHLPFVVGMTCLNGYFHDVYTESLAEALLEAPNGGAIAVWTSSSLTQPDQQSIMNQELFRQLFTPNPPTLGDAIARAKAVATDPDVRKSWILFGDPSMHLK